MQKVRSIKRLALLLSCLVGVMLMFMLCIHTVNATSNTLRIYNKTGGDFVIGCSKATVSYKAQSKSTRINIKIQDSSGKTVYKKTLKNIKKGKTYSVVWNGKNLNGQYVSSGKYRAVININGKTIKSSTIKFLKKVFAEGDGSITAPYQIANLKQLNKVSSYNDRFFIQTDNIDGNGETFIPLFSGDNRFSGNYNGNGKYISHLSMGCTGDVSGIFGIIGQNGIVRNLEVKNLNIAVAGDIDCDLGAIAGSNYGTVRDCTVSDISITNGENIGGVVGWSANTASIISCKAENITIDAARRGIDIGGIVGETNGIVSSCIASGVKITYSYSGSGGWHDTGIGGICGFMETSTAYVKKCEIVSLEVNIVGSSDDCKVGGVIGDIDESYLKQHIIDCINNTEY